MDDINAATIEHFDNEVNKHLPAQFENADLPSLTDLEKFAFLRMCEGGYKHYALFEGYINDEKGTVICHIDVPSSDKPRLTPVWASVRGLKIRDEFGNSFK